MVLSIGVTFTGEMQRNTYSLQIKNTLTDGRKNSIQVQLREPVYRESPNKSTDDSKASKRNHRQFLGSCISDDFTEVSVIEESYLHCCMTYEKL